MTAAPVLTAPEAEALAAYTCPNGHAYAPDTTTYATSHGRTHRRCRRCHRAADATYRARLKAVEREGAAWLDGYGSGLREGSAIGYCRGWDDLANGRARNPPRRRRP